MEKRCILGGWCQPRLGTRLAELASLRGKFKLKTRGDGGKDEIGKEENRETKIRIDQGIFNHEGRKMTRRSGGKDEIGENRKSGNSESAFWV